MGSKRKREVVGRGYCDECKKVVTVVFGSCHCDPDCRMQTWVCAECGTGMCPDDEP